MASKEMAHEDEEKNKNVVAYKAYIETKLHNVCMQIVDLV
jgi:hypothetical protein